VIGLLTQSGYPVSLTLQADAQAICKIPVFNCERYVEDCLSSVAGQSEGDIEIIAVDNGSTDRSVDLI
jgi:GT2 family glycosyltransferase